MVVVRKEKAYEKYAWIIPFVMGLFFLVSMAVTIFFPGILTSAENAVETLTGTPFSQLAVSSPGVANYIYYLITILAIFSAGLGAFIMIVSATGYRSARANLMDLLLCEARKSDCTILTREQLKHLISVCSGPFDSIFKFQLRKNPFKRFFLNDQGK